MALGVKQILLVDDDADLRRLITVALKENFSVVGCDSAEAALAKVDGNTSFDLLIVDVLLPGMSGLDFVRRMRTSVPFRSVPVLMITSQIGDETRNRCRDAGAGAFLHKPFTVREMKEAITRLTTDPKEMLKAAFAAHSRQ